MVASLKNTLAVKLLTTFYINNIFVSHSMAAMLSSAIML